MISIRMHSRDGERLLAACDREVLGKEFKGNGLRLKVSEIFYHSEFVTEEEFRELMKRATIMNLVGTRVIEIAISEGHVSEDAVIAVGGTEHAQAVMM